MNPVALQSGRDPEVLAACAALARANATPAPPSLAALALAVVLIALIGGVCGWGLAQRAPVYCARPLYDQTTGASTRIVCVESGRQIFVLH